jgi:tetratricopeptide (TPR) repeat protein
MGGLKACLCAMSLCSVWATAAHHASAETPPEVDNASADVPILRPIPESPGSNSELSAADAEFLEFLRKRVEALPESERIQQGLALLKASLDGAPSPVLHQRILISIGDLSARDGDDSTALDYYSRAAKASADPGLTAYAAARIAAMRPDIAEGPSLDRVSRWQSFRRAFTECVRLGQFVELIKLLGSEEGQAAMREGDCRTLESTISDISRRAGAMSREQSASLQYEVFRRITEHCPVAAEDLQFLANMAHYAEMAGDLAEAYALRLAIAKRFPHDKRAGDSLISAGMIAMQLGKTQECRELFQQALALPRLHPESRQTAELVLQGLQNMSSPRDPVGNGPPPSASTWNVPLLILIVFNLVIIAIATGWAVLGRRRRHR